MMVSGLSVQPGHWMEKGKPGVSLGDFMYKTHSSPGDLCIKQEHPRFPGLSGFEKLMIWPLETTLHLNWFCLPAPTEVPPQTSASQTLKCT